MSDMGYQHQIESTASPGPEILASFGTGCASANECLNVLPTTQSNWNNAEAVTKAFQNQVKFHTQKMTSKFVNVLRDQQ